jgi:uncharacterized metal-binding protein
MTDNKDCICSAAPKLLFPCSGAADVGEIADRAARKLTADGDGKMYCLAGLGGRISIIVENTKAASKVVAIDGCNLNCAERTLRQAGIKGFEHVRLEDLGMEKGKAPASDQNIERVASAVRTILLQETEDTAVK